MKYLITGGGTGGHIYPALAIAWEIKRRYKDAEILYVGTERGLESELVPKEGFEFRTIRVQGLPRKFNAKALKAIKEMMLGIMDARRIISEFKPDVVIGTGGYVSGPVVYAASKRNIPSFIHEQNAFPGITNRILSRYAEKVMITFEESKKYFKYQDKVVLTGNPIRRSILEVDKRKAYFDLRINPNNPLVLSFGGSGGQKTLNDTMLYVIEKNLDKNLQIIHVTGSRFYEDFMSKLKSMGIMPKENIKVVPYMYEMPKALSIADLVVTSAGAITLAEISALGIPSILIPKSYTAENHQEFNARAFEKNGASYLILEKDLTGEKLNKAINDIIYDRNKLKQMSNNSRKLGKIDAAERIVDIIHNAIKR
ncbi:MAG TPA: undecaprenyldiphospho-muramoylpentapeptide beta-N-acetylglucosaminyltransferase [Tissierellia bacterium]|nr:undecaprenyldiphospho-muramoylpentapeptide beta-N-acetylglucosaminyltransferase [Tissierellia bacterium]